MINLATVKTLEDLSSLKKRLEHGKENIDYLEYDLKIKNELVYIIYQGYISKQSLSIVEIEKATNKTRPTIKKYLKQLIASGSLYGEKQSRKIVYKLSQELIVQIEQ